MHRAPTLRAISRATATILGAAALGAASLALTPGVALADTCRADPHTAHCAPSGPDLTTASAQSGDNFAEASATPDRTSVNGSNDDSSSSASNVGTGALLSSAAADHSTATAKPDPDGGPSTSSAAAADHSSADARNTGEDSTSGAAAADHSTALARAFGDDSHARAGALHHDRAYAVAGPDSTADVSPHHAHCSGLGGGVEFRTLSACAGPVHTPSHDRDEDDDSDD